MGMIWRSVRDSIVASRPTDAALAFFVVAITAMLLIPLPTPLLDVLLVLNLSVALLLLLVGLYMPNALALLAFPSLLLLTTLFRLSLNVASTRLILSQADAGEIIHAFGTFLIRGEIVVGIIIFAIITIVNFIVIARGATRVSEVAARFALDALPGKQMAIDADLRSGTMSAEEAQSKREDLRKESQLYGAMDGAMKFVQGDAIAGLFIIVTNILGGIYIGVSQGMSFADAAQTYTILTVGDGLVSQVPALLISICAGIVVTRISSGENTTLGTDVGNQLFARPGMLLVAGAGLLLMACLPGLPWKPFLIVGLAFIAAGWLTLRQRSASMDGGAIIPALRAASRPLLPAPGLLGSSVGRALDGRSESGLIRLVLDSAVLHRAHRLSATRHEQWWRELQQDLREELGLELPDPVVTRAEGMRSSSYSIEIGGIVVEEGQVPLDAILVEVHPASAPLLGAEVLQAERHPLSGIEVFWARQTSSLQRTADACQIRSFDFFGFIGLKVAGYLRQHPQDVVTLTAVHGWLKQFEKRHPGLLAEALNRSYLSVARLTEVFQELVRQGVNIHDVKQILEAVAAYSSSAGAGLSGEDEFNLNEVVSFIRESRRRQLVARLLTSRRTLRVVTLSPEVEELLSNDGSSGADVIAPEHYNRLRAGLGQLITPILERGLPAFAVVCQRGQRASVAYLSRGLISAGSIITARELDPEVRIEPVGVWELAT